MASIPPSDLTYILPPIFLDTEPFLPPEPNDNIWSRTSSFLGNGTFDSTPPENDQASPDFRMWLSNRSGITRMDLARWSSANVHGSATGDFVTYHQCGSCAASREEWKIHCIGNNGQTGVKIPRYSVEERKDRIHKYLKKKNQRNFNKTIKYACQKTLADRRRRVRGRFASNTGVHEEAEENEYRDIVSKIEDKGERIGLKTHYMSPFYKWLNDAMF